MFEAHVVNLLKKYLGQYVRGLSEEALKISVWKGDVVLNNLQLKAEALNGLNLPITVKAGFLGSVRLKVPWNRLGKDPVIVLLDRIFILAEPATGDSASPEETEEELQDALQRKIVDAEVAAVEAKQKRNLPPEQASESSSWLASLIATVVGNLKISITNVHIRYEDTTSNVGSPFCIGLTLKELAAFTIDDNGKETFVTAGALDKLRKAVDLERLAIYHNCDSKPWESIKPWDSFSPEEWSKRFEPVIANDAAIDGAPAPQYLLHPIKGRMRYLRQGKSEKREPDVPYQKAWLTLNDVSLTISERQYEDSMRLVEGLTTIRKRQEVAHLRPRVPVKENPTAWWRFAGRAVQEHQQKLRQRLSWKDVQRLSVLRREYVEKYASLLLESSKPTADSDEIRSMQAGLSPELVLMWRMLAHTQVDRIRPPGQLQGQNNGASGGWLGWVWGGRAQPKESPTSAERPVGLSDEEWAKLDELVSYEPGQDSNPLLPEEDSPHMLQLVLEVTVERNTLRAVDREGCDVLAGSFASLQAGLKMYPKCLNCDLRLGSYGLSSPEGNLIESVSKAGREDALAASFVQAPFDRQLDWMLTATVSPCHVTVWRASLDRFTSFLKSGQAASPALALETAAALQSKLDDVRRQAQEQLQAVLKTRSKFAIDLDLDAPKVAVPVSDAAGGRPGTQLLLDLGHFTLRTDEDDNQMVPQPDSSELYTRFKLTGTDISAVFVDSSYDRSQASSPLKVMEGSPSENMAQEEAQEPQRPQGVILPMLERCAMAAVLHQLAVPHPTLPSTRIAVWLPRLAFHFSPARYHRLMTVVKAISAAKEEPAPGQTAVSPWGSPDFAGPVWELRWAGLASTTAEWLPRWAVLSGSYLYILESETSSTYLTCTSLVNKVVVDVPEDRIGDSPNVIAVCNRGTDPTTVVQSGQSIVLRLPNEDSELSWEENITIAIYKASGHAAASSLIQMEEDNGSHREVEKQGSGHAADAAATGTPVPAGNIIEGTQQQLYVVGVLDRLQLSISSTAPNSQGTDEECNILELRASGGKVELLQRQYDMALGVGVHELEILDLMQASQGNAKGESACYMARSLLIDPPTDAEKGSPGSSPENEAAEGGGNADENDEFMDARQEFPSSPSSGEPSTPLRGGSGLLRPMAAYFDAEGLTLNDLGISEESQPPSFEKTGQLLPTSDQEPDMKQIEDFVKLQLAMRQSSSPDYDGVDMQMVVDMATLEFFCNRPTLVAIMDIGRQMSQAPGDASNHSDTSIPSETEADTDEVVGEARGDQPEEGVPSGMQKSVVKGLMGGGRARVVFGLRANMQRARIYLNLEDGRQLALLEQERISVDLKTFPAALSISVELGNLRMCNMQLGRQHQWGWFCDLRDPASASLVQVEFQSFSQDDADYPGYEYSLTGHLSAVRIVFLYRFIQELSAYFSGLAPPTSEQIDAVQDAVGEGLERIIKQAEMVGSPGIHLDFGLDAPELIMPRNSQSSDFMQLGLGHLQVSNIIEWRGGSPEDLTAVRVDTMTVESRNVTMMVGLGGKLGPPMVQELAGVKFVLQRPLRDLKKRLPVAEVHVELARVRAVMSDREYTLITECASANMAEPPELPKNFHALPARPSTPAKEQTKPADKSAPAAASTASGSWTAIRLVLDLKHVELELFTGPVPRESSLALLQIQGLWVEYRTTSDSESEILLTLPRISVLDQRRGTRPEMRLMMGSALDAELDNTMDRTNSTGGPGRLTMVVMNVVLKPAVRMVEIRIQRPRLLVAFDFLLALGEFFVPSLGAMAGKEDSRDVREDPLCTQNDIRLVEPAHRQVTPVEWLASERQLVADGAAYDEFVYDGNGGTLVLLREPGGEGLDGPPPLPLIWVGQEKCLRFKNVTIMNGLHLDESVHLSGGSSYLALEADGVKLEGSGITALEAGVEGVTEAGEYTADDSAMEAAPAVSNFALDIQAMAPELTFYDTTKWASASAVRPEKLLRAKMDVNLLMALKGPDTYVLASVRGFMVETAGGLAVVEPLDVVTDFSRVGGKTKLDVTATDIALRMPLKVVRLLQRLQTDLTTAIRLGGSLVTVSCTRYDRVWRSNPGQKGAQQFAIWRPRAPPGFVIVGDCATEGDAPPTQAVLAISTGFRRVKKPTGFTLLWRASPPGTADPEQCHMWLPVAPPGYVALGCVAHFGADPPSLSTVHCVRADLVTPCSIGDCLFFDAGNSNRGPPVAGKGSLWLIDNAMGTFYASAGLEPPGRAVPKNLRQELRSSANDGISNNAGPNASTASVQSSSQSRSTSLRTESLIRQASTKSPGLRQYLNTSDLQRVWWDKGSDVARHVTIWRPQAPAGYAILGDIAMEGYECPDAGVVILDEKESGRVACPVKYEVQGHISGRGLQDITLWFPVAPPGYVALGCITSGGVTPPLIEAVRCIRMDLVNQRSFAARSMWSWSSSGRGDPELSLWPVENQASTFFAWGGTKKPPWRMAYSLAELEKPKEPANVDAQIMTNRVSCTVFDDFSGVLTPLADLSVTGIQLAVHGRPEAINAVVFTSVAASTFNPPLGVWEPLIEPFDGIFKYESRDSSADALGGGTHVRITATSVVNVNLSSAGIDAFAGAALAWQKAAELEQEQDVRSTFNQRGVQVAVEEGGAALDNEEGLRLLVENQLGEPLFARIAKDRFTNVHPLQPGETVPLPLPRQRPSDARPYGSLPLVRSPRHFMAIRIIEAQELVVAEDVTGVELVCHLRMAASGGKPSADGKLMPQSARSSGMHSDRVLRDDGIHVASATWDEVFVFEIPNGQEGLQLDVHVTNQAANAGKGEAIGATAIPMDTAGRVLEGSPWTAVKAALAIGQSTWGNTELKTYALHRVPKHGEMLDGDEALCGQVLVADYFFTVGASGHVQTARSVLEEEEAGVALDSLIQLSVSPDGPWAALRSVAAIMSATMSIAGRPVALEAGVRGGLKYVALRSLAVLTNAAGTALEVAICPRSQLGRSEDGSGIEDREEDEVYENQRYQPLMGWGSSWPGHLLPSDPTRFSNLDYSWSSQELPRAPPKGWTWTSNWGVDRFGAVDAEGWFYGADFRSLREEAKRGQARAKGPLHFVRRRRLIRSRAPVNAAEQVARKVVGVLQPGDSLSLPWNSLQPGSDWCLQMRPFGGGSETSDRGSVPSYAWSKVVNVRSGENGEGASLGGSSRGKATDKAFVLADLAVPREASKREEMLECTGPRDSWWLCLEADAVRLHGETSAPVFDWRLTVRAPLKLENRLPCVAEFRVFEKGSLQARTISRLHGLVEAGEAVHVHTVAIQRRILLTFLPQGGWKPEKEAVVISDPFAVDLPASFWMVNDTSNRRLRVSLENDMGGSEAAAKIVRLFVPYWLRNDLDLPLSYRLVQMELAPSQPPDSLWLARATKSAKLADQLPKRAFGEGTAGSPIVSQKVVKSLEVIEESAGSRPVMLSLPAAPNVGLSVGLSPAGVFSSAILLKTFEDKMERMELKAVDPNGSYIKLALSLDLSSLGYERTKVVCLQPSVLYSNRTGQSLFLCQIHCSQVQHLEPGAVNRPLRWHSIWEPELLQMRANGYEWSRPFSVEVQGTMHIRMRSSEGVQMSAIRAEVTSGANDSRLHIAFRMASAQAPYRVENRSMLLPVRFRQAGGDEESWQQLNAGCAAVFAWEDLRRERLLEIMVDGADNSTSRLIPLHEEGQHEPPMSGNRPVAALRVSVEQEGPRLMCVRIFDWKPSDSVGILPLPYGAPGSIQQTTSGLSAISSQESVQAATPSAEEANSGKLFITLSLDEFGLSLVDHTPEELLYLSMQTASIAYETNSKTGSSRVSVRVGHLQIDNQVALTAMPVLLAPQETTARVRQDYVLKLSVTSQDVGLLDEQLYRYIGMQLPSAAWLVNIHEPIIWRLLTMLRKLNLSRLSTPSSSTAVDVDPRVRITLFHMSEGRLKVTLAMAPSQRPRGILGFWSTLITSLGNTDEMPIRISEKVHENIYMRKSQLTSAATQSISNDLLSQPFQLLSGLDVLGNASSALGHMSKGVAALSMDATFIRSRQRQESKANVEGLGDGLIEGGEALVKGLYRGVTGILTKPVEGARATGVEGFVTGMGKGIIGVAAQPVSGMLDLVSKTADGVNATRMKISAAMSEKLALVRRRQPRAIRGDNILRPYDEYAARGQAILQLAERGTLFGSALFDMKERGKFAMTDAYEDHHNLPRRHTLMVTHRRVILLQHPQPLGQKVDLLKEPCTVLWDVPWEELMTMEVKRNKDSPPSAAPSRLVLHLRDWSQENRLFEAREIARTVQCHPGTSQATEIRASLAQALAKYGPDNSTVAAQTKKRRADSRPYTGAASGAASGAALGFLAGPAAPVAIPVMATFGALVGGAGQVMLEDDGQEPAGPRDRSRARVANTPAQSGHLTSSPAPSMELSARAGKLMKSFLLVWSDRGAVGSAKFPVSIWRAAAPQGYVSMGDIVRSGYEPPEKAMVYRDDGDGKFVQPDGFDLIWRDTDSGAKTPVTIWMPRAPAGYIALGCVAIADYYEPDQGVVCCARRDCVAPASLSKDAAWHDRMGAALWKCSFWQVLNDARTFLARRDHEKPSAALAFTVAV